MIADQNLITSWNNIREFVITVRVSARADDTFHDTSDKARIKLIIELEQSLVDKNNRLKFLQAVTGLMIDSQIRLLSHYTSVFIEEVKDGKNRQTIQDIERYIESHPDILPWNLFPWEHPAPQVPDV